MLGEIYNGSEEELQSFLVIWFRCLHVLFRICLTMHSCHFMVFHLFKYIAISTYPFLHGLQAEKMYLRDLKGMEACFDCWKCGT